MKVLYWDIETSSIDIKYRTYDLKVTTTRFAPETIERDWTILSVAWAINDERVKCISVSPQNPLNDFEVVKTFHAVLNDCDCFVGHNVDAFDIKKFNTRAIAYGLHPIGKKTTIDTLKIARRHFKFTSNKLRYIAKFFSITEKDGSPDWDACLLGDADALAYMREYNRTDVEVTRQLYYKLRAYHENHPDFNAIRPVRDICDNIVYNVCKVCGSADTVKNGSWFGLKGRVKKRMCKSCGHNFREQDDRVARDKQVL
jgi:DNA polymerase elongation subunit (family B)/Zn ribbon nucleic-acid-binding protein